MVTDDQLGVAFGEFSEIVQSLAQKVNQARRAMEKAKDSNDTFDTGGNTFKGNGRTIRDYENALEELKGFIENRSSGQVHNVNLKREIESEKHAIRALEVELVHGNKLDPEEYLITGIVVRGLISIQPADGNEAPSYSSKSSSSSVRPPAPA